MTSSAQHTPDNLMEVVPREPADSPEAANTRRSSLRRLYLLAALAVAALLLFLSLRGIQWADVWKMIRRANGWLLLASLGLSSFSLLLRALRWRVLLRSRHPVSLSLTFWATSAGYFGNSFLPARAGELLRTLMVSSISGLSRTFVLTTALSERLCDAVTLVLISSIILLALPVKPGWFKDAATPFAIAGICGVAAIAILPAIHRPLQNLLARISMRGHLRDKLLAIIDQVLSGMRSFHNGKRLAGFCALTIVIWFSDAFGVVLGMRALGLPGNMPLAFLLTTGLALGSALPSTPGYVGIYQFVAVSVLTPFGFSKTAAITYILVAQALQYLHISFWGGLGLLRFRSAKLATSAAALSRKRGAV